uniref:Peptidase S1 domain-containing protein n=1 Tax=Anopheles funestus TaxID=62324 RepID=A0A4Y0BV36_ANOFN
MHCWGFLLVICSCMIISSVANVDAGDFQECPGGFWMLEDLCPNGMYNESYAQSKGLITPRLGVTVGGKEVCCTNKTQLHKSVDRDNERTTVSNERAMEYECGLNNPHGIGNQSKLDHTYAKSGEYPWVVLILQQGTMTTVCQGTLIHPRFVLTTAHHFEPNDSFVARFGEWDYNQEINALPKQNIDIENIIVHPEYVSKGLRNDIALARLKRNVLYDAHIRPICLPGPNDLFDGQQCTSAGWGRMQDLEFASVLKRVDLPVIPRQECKQLFARTILGPFFRLHKSVLCAGAMKDQDMCDGDGGSGLFCPTESGSYVLAGIVSWGLGCHQQDVPGAYVNVAKFVPWIQSTINERV